MVLLRVCATWAEIALSTPALWATIHVDCLRAKGFERFFDSYLTRTRGRELCLSFRGRIDPAISPLLVQQAHRVKNLELRQIQSHLDLLVAASFSNLATLTLSTVGAPHPQMIDINALLSMLGASPGLVECTLDNIECTMVSTTDDKLVLPSLQSLYLGRDLTAHFSSSRILRRVTLPALRILAIYNLDIDADDMTSFLTRSAAPLKSLTLCDPLDNWEIPLIAPIFGLMPALASLRMFFVDSDVNVISLLDSPSSGIFPELRSLEITAAHWGDIRIRVWADTIYRTVSARRGQLGSARIVLPHATNRPDPDVLDPFRQFVAECGMKIHFGTEELNFI